MSRGSFKVIAFALQLIFCSQVLAQTTGAFPGDKEIETQLENSNVLGTHCEFRAKLDQKNDLLNVTTTMVPGATDKDYKINAVLIGKKAMSICGKNLAKVSVTFKGKDGAERNAVIRAGDVKAFGSKLESEDVLLASIDLSHKDATSASPQKSPNAVEPNERAITRALKLAGLRIFGLALQRIDVSKFKEMSNSAQASLEAKKLPEAASIIDDLNQQLKEQEDLSKSQRRGLRHH